MSRNNTGNPIDSKAYADFEDNVKNMDVAVNSDELEWVDRFGRSRRTLAGVDISVAAVEAAATVALEQTIPGIIEDIDAEATASLDAAESGWENRFQVSQDRREGEFQADQADRETEFRTFIASSGYQFAGDYAAGIEITQYNQLVRDENGEFWRVSGQVDLLYTTTGAGMPESGAFVPVGDAALRQEIATVLPELRVPDYSYTQMGKGFDTTDPSAPVNAAFAAWVHATVDYDEADDNFVIFYNINAGHSIATNRVLLTKKAPEGGFSTPVVVADKTGVESLKTQAAGIAASGEYIALIGVFNWGSSTPIRTDIYRSADKGATWSIATMIDSATGDPIIAFNGDVSGFLKLASGRIITLACEPAPSYLTRIYYSDDNGATWTKASIAGNPTDVTEPGWVELPDGTIVCMARAAVRRGSTSQKIPAKFMLSYDSGVTWTEPVDSTSITDFTLSNGQMILDTATGQVEFIHHSRYAQPDGFSSLYVSRATFADAKDDRFSQQVRIGRLAAYVPIDNSSGDSGYVGASMAKSGVINAFYYNGLRNSAQINWAIGRRGATKEREYEIDYVTGDRPDNRIREYENAIYSDGIESPLFSAPLVLGYRSGSSSIATNYLKSVNEIRISLISLGRVGVTPLGGINLDGVTELYVDYDAVTLDDGVDFGIYLYDKETPSTVTDGRIKTEISTKTGKNRIYLDVADFSGIYYPQLVLSKASSGDANGDIRITGFGFISDFKRVPTLDSPTYDKSLYYRGNKNPYTSKGWDSAYSEVANGSTVFTEDSIVITADGSGGSSSRRAACTGLVDLTAIKLIEAVADVSITDTTVGDFGLAIFTKPNPTSANDGRVKFAYSKQTGVSKYAIDVRDLVGEYYVFLVANANMGTSEPSIVVATVLDVRMY